MRRRWLLVGALVALLGLTAVVLSAALFPARTAATSTAELGLILLDEEDGVVVLAVQEKSVADRAGLRPGDMLMRANDKPFSTVAELEQLMQNNAATMLRMEIQRAERLLNVRFRLLEKIH